MGKSSKIRARRADAALNNPKEVKKSAPSWLYPTIALVAAVALVFGLVAVIISNNGTIQRYTDTLKSENYEISATELQYLFMNEYQNFYSTYQSYLSLFSLNTEEDLAHQQYGSGYETTVLGEFDGTWRDYFMSKALTRGAEVLIYCEEADERGIKLEEADYASIDASIAEIETMVAYYNMLGYGYTVDTYISDMYGKGVKEKDIRSYLEMYTLATKCTGIVGEELMDAITPERVDAEYAENSTDYNLTDYSFYTVRVNFTDVAKEVIPNYDGKAELTEEQKTLVLEKYTEKINEAKALIEELSAYTTPETFEAALLNHIASESFDTLYTAEALIPRDALSEADLATVKSAMIAKVLAEVEDGLSETADETTETDGTFTAYGVTVSETAATSLDTIKRELFDAIVDAEDAYIIEKVNYVKDSEIPEWAFDASTTVGSVKVTSSGDGSGEGEIKNESDYFSTSVYMLTKGVYRDTEVSRKVAYMIFSSEEKAKAAIAELAALEEITEEKFNEIAANNSSSEYATLENCLKGTFGYDEAEAWYADEATVKGSFSAEPIALVKTEGSESYGVFWYIDDAEEGWYITVEASIYAADADAKYLELLDKHTVETLYKNVEKVAA